MKILLIGNPNVGKSVVFNRLTGASVLASNYPGTTVEFTSGYMPVGSERAEVIDVPGTYSLEPTCPAEEVACRMLSEKGQDVIINVVDATNLERSLNLTLQLVQQRVHMVIDLNMWDETRHTGVEIDIEKLEDILGVPVVTTTATTGEGIKDLVEKIPLARKSGYEFEDKERWHEVGDIVKAVQTITHRHHTLLERLGDASVRPFTGIPIAVLVLFTMFMAIYHAGEAIKGYVFDPVFEHLWLPLLVKISSALGGEGFLHKILIGRLGDNGKLDFKDFEGALGLLTTGIYIPIAIVLSYVFIYYLVLSFLEDSGYLPRLAVLMDTIMHRLGMHGMCIVPFLLGCGCNVPGVLATRIMESRRQRFITALLMSITIPCLAQSALIISLAEGHIWVLPVIFATLFIVWLALGLIFKHFIKGESPEIILDIPPYRIPYMRGLLKKLWMRMFWFLKEAVPYVLLGIFIVGLLDQFGIIDFIGRLTKPVVETVLGLPGEAVGGLIAGFLRKDVAVGMLLPLKLSGRQIAVAGVVLTMYFPCVATFAVMFKEFGWKDMVKAALVMVVSSLAVGALLNLILKLCGA